VTTAFANKRLSCSYYSGLSRHPVGVADCTPEDIVEVAGGHLCRVHLCPPGGLWTGDYRVVVRDLLDYGLGKHHRDSDHIIMLYHLPVVIVLIQDCYGSITEAGRRADGN
jgi:hypothetical protein